MQRTGIWATVAAMTIVGGTTAIAVSTGVGAVDDPPSSGYVPIAPCRLFDTRPAPFNVGDRMTPIGAGETHEQPVTGTVGNCEIPTDAVGLNINLTAVNGTADSFLTVSPAGGELPVASSLNWVAGAPPTPNQISVALADGAIDLYNQFGTVDVVGDVVGYSTTADFDALADAIAQNDDEIVTLTSEFNTLDDAVSQKADADDVYTKDVANAIHGPIPYAGGVVNGGTGTKVTDAYSFGTWTVTKTGPGQYRVDMLTRSGCDGVPRPYVLVTPTEVGIALADLVACLPDGSWRFFVNIRNTSNTIGLDTVWMFTVFA